VNKQPGLKIVPKPFSKTAKTYPEQLAILMGRGLVVADPGFAVHCLVHHNYYRLSAYRFPLTVHGNPDLFLPGTTFDQLWALYEFDRQLRHLTLEASKRVEISVRSRWAYEAGHKLGPQAYENSAHFTDAVEHTKTLGKVDDELRRSDEKFIKHFRDIYATKRPAIWAACETMSFGQTFHFYSSLVDAALRQAIAATYGLDERALASFLHHLNIVRNTCAHHARLWNRQFTITLQPPISKPAALIPSLDPVPPVSHAVPHPKAPNKIYNTLVMLAHLMEIIDPPAAWRDRLRETIERQVFPVANHMGFPADWSQRPIWRPRLAPP
jgi:abortive infection bacteriophage resistance protein